MGSTPLVSIVMPLYNKRPYVKRAIDSIMHQTFSDWELIIVDDGSTDDSSSAIPRSDPRIRFIWQENSGPGAARNRGISIAKGELVTFIDADDYYYPQKIEEEMTLLYKEKMAEWMISASEYQTDNRMKFQGIDDINGNAVKGPPLVFNNALKQLTISNWPSDGLCVGTSLLKRLGGFNEDMRCYEITDLLIRCALAQPKVLIYPGPLYCVTDTANSAYKVSSHRIQGLRQLGESFNNLSKQYPEFSSQLKFRSQNLLLKHAARLILAGESDKGRAYLTRQFPYERDKRWWKWWLLSWAPKWLLAVSLNIRKSPSRDK